VRLELINENPGSQTPTIQFKYEQYESRRTLIAQVTTNNLNDTSNNPRTAVWMPRDTVQEARAAMPTATDIRLVRETFDLIVPISGVAADMFYERLFYMAPSLRRMFPEDMRDQKRQFMIMIATAVQSLNDLDALLPQLMELGAHHARYGVTDAHYKTIGETLIWTLERGLANAFTPEVEHAWLCVYLFIAAAMQAGADEARALRAAE
jgi:hemoglobin-like flavoprotein